MRREARRQLADEHAERVLPSGVEPDRRGLEDRALHPAAGAFGDVPRDRAEPFQFCRPKRTPVLHVITERTAGIEPASKNLADFRLTNRPRSQTLERAPRFELGWHGLEGRLLT